MKKYLIFIFSFLVVITLIKFVALFNDPDYYSLTLINLVEWSGELDDLGACMLYTELYDDGTGRISHLQLEGVQQCYNVKGFCDGHNTFCEWDIHDSTSCHGIKCDLDLWEIKFYGICTCQVEPHYMSEAECNDNECKVVSD